MVEMGGFLNEYATKLHVFLPLAVFLACALPAFGIYFNYVIDNLAEGDEHMSLYVAIGVAVTLTLTALLSWKAAVVLLIAFALDGLPMIAGEFRRTKRTKQERATRIKRLPYKANGAIDEIDMATKEMRRLLNSAFKTKDEMERAIKLAGISNEVNNIAAKVFELKNIQRGE